VAGAQSACDVLDPVTVAGPRRLFTGLPLTTDRLRERVYPLPPEASSRRALQLRQDYLIKEAPMTDEPPLSMEMVVANAICVAPKSREVLEAELGGDVAPLSDEAVMLENMIAMVNRHGLLVAQLAIVPDTRAELLASMPDAVKRVPAWMEARVNGAATMTARLFVRGLAQLLGEHRRAIERVTAEQVDKPEPIEEWLAAAPLPGGGEEESNSEAIAAVGQAIAAHAEALVEIARDFDQLRGELRDPR